MHRPWSLLAVVALGACQRAAPVPAASGPVRQDDAGKYVLGLVNRDREQAGLGPVEWDDRAARAAQAHVRDMAAVGFTGHWGSDGSVPEERYTLAGGEDFVQENAACFFDGQAREIDPDAVFDPAILDRIQGAFTSEVPPNDGHRKNILGPTHNRLGVGLAQPRGVSQACLVQEFVDDYGRFDPLPAEAKVGDVIQVRGEVTDAIEFGGVGIARIEPAAPVPVADLVERSTYQVPVPYVMYFPAGFETPKPVQVDGPRFSIDVVLDDGRRPGRYEVSVWGKHPGSEALVMVSLRTIVVR